MGERPEPVAVLKLPVLAVSAVTPVAVLSWPAVLDLRASKPLAVLRRPVVVKFPALAPTNVFSLPPEQQA